MFPRRTRIQFCNNSEHRRSNDSLKFIIEFLLAEVSTFIILGLKQFFNWNRAETLFIFPLNFRQFNDPRPAECPKCVFLPVKKLKKKKKGNKQRIGQCTRQIYSTDFHWQWVSRSIDGTSLPKSNVRAQNVSRSLIIDILTRLGGKILLCPRRQTPFIHWQLIVPNIWPSESTTESFLFLSTFFCPRPFVPRPRLSTIIYFHLLRFSCISLPPSPPRIVSFRFRCPSWKIRDIRRVNSRADA